MIASSWDFEGAGAMYRKGVVALEEDIVDSFKVGVDSSVVCGAMIAANEVFAGSRIKTSNASMLEGDDTEMAVVFDVGEVFIAEKKSTIVYQADVDAKRDLC